LPVDHYENFPVASWLLPSRLREPVEAIYAFARSADDIADEGTLSDAARLRGLERYDRALDEIAAGATPADPPFRRLAAAVATHGLPIALLRDLIDAFRQDVTVKRYPAFSDLMDYSRRSANPVGRLLLHLFDERSPEALAWSDAICSGLQVVNFWQDVELDWAKGRVYIPLEDLERFGVPESDIAERRADARWSRLMAFEVARAREMLLQGAPLGARLPGRVGLEIRATVQGGLAILDRIDAVAGDVFRYRPRLRRADWIRILARAVPRRPPKAARP
jgi:squalene synthase HpnC